MINDLVTLKLGKNLLLIELKFGIENHIIA